MEGKTQETAAAKAGMSARSARKWQSGPLPSATKPEHRWRTRPDPFDGVWEDEIEPLLRNDPTGKLKAHCLKSNVTELRSHKVSWRIQPRNARYPGHRRRKDSPQRIGEPDLGIHPSGVLHPVDTQCGSPKVHYVKRSFR